MIIDACRHSFSTLSARVLPKHMADLEAALGTALPARHCQSKSAWAGKYGLVTSGDAQSLSLFQQFA